ncbi:glycosyltransferase family 39 protein [Mucilaginibacter sp. ZT4R22]|uniref:Glycosyltransferase family 39 protein n=1 Tax=Mucilaginibacter pankratovii TaxID=2772110 RepID=A0ABR7WRD0_9SPHI|nr:glycosyltransferase family 39 protein [Mucilaginibacter pankratovii]MBD1363919.1 glycosyltransferase family 39 protein [Mucilaginibacter pankratovii]
MEKAITSPRGQLSQSVYYYVMAAAILVNIAGIGIPFFSDDPALYAMLARNMAQTNNFTDLYYHGRDWLDKPHFPFWVVALSFKMLGVNTIAYKLPALLFYFMSVFYTYKLGRKFYDMQTALLAVLILLTAQHTIMSNTDVRAEPYIMGLLIGSIYHFYKLKEKFSIAHLLLASLFAACAVMTKGIYLLIPIGSAIIGDYLFKKDFKGLLQWRWLLSFLLVCLFVLPEVYTVYVQFDQHPEKMVFGRTGVSGIQWFLWGSQFGRFNNDGFIKNSHGDPFFFLHTLLWAFAPWAIVFFYALGKKIRDIIKGKPQPEYICLSAALVMLLIFSISKFQLPFYTNILFPFFAVITAGFISSLAGGAEARFFNISQYIICGLLLAVFVALGIAFAPGKIILPVILFIAGAGAVFFIYRQQGQGYRPVFLLSCVVMIIINTYFVLVFYPVLLSYKGDEVAACYVNTNYPGQQVVSTAPMADRFDFYMKEPVAYATAEEIIQHKKTNTHLVFADDDAMEQLKNSPRRIQVLKVFDNYFGENLKLSFINQATRKSALIHFYLIRVN